MQSIPFRNSRIVDEHTIIASRPRTTRRITNRAAASRTAAASVVGGRENDNSSTAVASSKKGREEGPTDFAPAMKTTSTVEVGSVKVGTSEATTIELELDERFLKRVQGRGRSSNNDVAGSPEDVDDQLMRLFWERHRDQIVRQCGLSGDPQDIDGQDDSERDARWSTSSQGSTADPATASSLNSSRHGESSSISSEEEGRAVIARLTKENRKLKQLNESQVRNFACSTHEIRYVLCKL